MSKTRRKTKIRNLYSVTYRVGTGSIALFIVASSESEAIAESKPALRRWQKENYRSTEPTSFSKLKLKGTMDNNL